MTGLVDGRKVRVDAPDLPVWWHRLTVEHGLYGVLFVAAAAMRLPALGNAPLSPAEATEALAVWDFWTPESAVSLPGSPVFFSLASLLTQLLGYGDAVMRIIPVLFGLGSVLVPWGLRSLLGRIGALAVALLLAASPMHALASRTVGGQSAALFAGLLLFAALINYQRSADRRWLGLLALAVALGLSSDSLFYGLLVTLAVAWSAGYVLNSGMNGEENNNLFRLPSTDRDEWRRVMAMALGTFVAASTLFLWRLDGLGAAARLPLEWLARFAGASNDQSIVSPLLALARYEPIVVIIGAPVAIWTIRRAKMHHRLLVYWFLGALFLTLLQRGYVANVLILSLPGYLLIAVFFNHLASYDTAWIKWPVVAAIVFAGGVVYLNVVRFSRLTISDLASPDESFHLLLMVVTIALTMAVLIFLWNWDRGVTIQASVAGLTVLLLVYGWGTGWWINRYAANDTRERWVEEATDNDIRLLGQSIREISLQTTNSENGLRILSTVPSPALRWYLRDFSNLVMANTLPRSADFAALLTPTTSSPVLENDYVGTDFGFYRANTPHQLDFDGALRWWLFHQSPIPINEERLVFWLRSDLTQ